MKQSLLVILFAFSTIAAYSQGRQQMAPEDRATQLDELIFKDVEGLSKKQRGKISAANLEMAQKQTELRATGDRDTMRTKMTEVRDSYNSKMKEILDDEQFVQFNRVMEAQRQGRRPRPGN